MSVELLAPVGSIESFKAAIQNYADAVYLAGKAFGARAYADNFTNDELKSMIEYAHFFGVKVYVTVNTIIYDDEFDELINFLDFLYLNDCDAVIVQDLGVANLIHKRYPNMELHASTQMNIHSLEQVNALKTLGFSRVVLARELSIEEIKQIKNNTDMEIEVFVHGALCVSYSGNCYISSIVGKRSGNRGRCAQPCRLEYSIKDKDGYLISTKDLNTLAYVKELIEVGIDSFKIEGRMRRPEYVAQVLQSYRQAINNYYQQDKHFNLELQQEELKKIFNRDFTKGFIFNEENNEFTNPTYSNHIGIEIGKVVFSSKDWIQIKLIKRLVKNDSIRLVGLNTDAITVNQMYKGKEIVEVAESGDIIRLKPHVENLLGAKVFLTTSFSQISSLQKTFDKEYRTIGIDGSCYLEDDFLVLEVNDGKNFVKVTSQEKVQKALNQASNDRIVEQFKKTMNTVFRFKNLNVNLLDNIFISIKEINEMRRKALEHLREKIVVKHSNRMIKDFSFYQTNHQEPDRLKMKVKVRNIEQLQVVLNYPVDEIYVTDQKLLKMQESYPNIKFSYVVPRINKRKQALFKDLNIVTSDISLVENNNTSVYFNIVNNYAINLLEKMNVKTIALSLELSFNQIKALVKKYMEINSRKPDFEMMVYGRYELMMMKYCPMSNSIGCEDCKKIPEEESVLTDRKNFAFPMLREKDCTVKILNSKKLHLIDYVEDIYASGIMNLLLDFTDEQSDEVGKVCEIYFNNKKEIRLEEVTFGHFKEGVL